MRRQGLWFLAGALALAGAASGCAIKGLPVISKASPAVEETFAAAAGRTVGDASFDASIRRPQASGKIAGNPLAVVGTVGVAPLVQPAAGADNPATAPGDTVTAPADPFPPLEPGKARLLVTIAKDLDFPPETIPAGWRRIQVIPLGTALIRMTLDGPRLDAPITYEVEPPPPGVTYKQQLFTGLPPGASYMVTALCLNAAGRKLASGFKSNIDLGLGNNALNLPMALEPFDAGLIF